MRRLLFTTLLFSVSLAPTLLASPFSFGFNSIGNAAIRFDPTDISPNTLGTFSFTNDSTTGYDFVVSSMTGGWPNGETAPGANGDLLGLRGKIVGTYGIQAPIVTTFAGPPLIETATVKSISPGAHQLQLYNAAGTLALTADLAWASIQTNTAGGGGSGTLNVLNELNLSNFVCSLCPSGSNLAFLGSSTAGKAQVTFQDTANAFSLTSLTQTGPRSFTAYSGTATVPEPGFYGLLAIGLSGLSWIAVRRRQKQISI